MLFTPPPAVQAQQLNLDNIANNLANSSTTGFRSRRLQFEILDERGGIVAPGSVPRSKLHFPAACRSASARARRRLKFSRRRVISLKPGNPLDLTITGQGFFQVTLPTVISAIRAQALFIWIHRVTS